MKVNTLRGHGNAYGVDYWKDEGGSYDHPDPKHLIDEKTVELADPLDHDGDGRPGGSLPGAESTRTKGAGKTKLSSAG